MNDEQSPEVREALAQLERTRNSLQERIDQQEAKARQPRSRALTGPRPRHVRAEETFNGDPKRVAVWDAAVEQAKRGPKVRLTAELIQLAILAYYDQRRIDVAAGTKDDPGSAQP